MTFVGQLETLHQSEECECTCAERLTAIVFQRLVLRVGGNRFQHVVGCFQIVVIESPLYVRYDIARITVGIVACRHIPVEIVVHAYHIGTVVVVGDTYRRKSEVDGIVLFSTYAELREHRGCEVGNIGRDTFGLHFDHLFFLFVRYCAAFGHRIEFASRKTCSDGKKRCYFDVDFHTLLFLSI